MIKKCEGHVVEHLTVFNELLKADHIDHTQINLSFIENNNLNGHKSMVWGRFVHVEKCSALLLFKFYLMLIIF
jgi:hypothetical protein